MRIMARVEVSGTYEFLGHEFCSYKFGKLWHVCEKNTGSYTVGFRKTKTEALTAFEEFMQFMLDRYGIEKAKEHLDDVVKAKEERYHIGHVCSACWIDKDEHNT
jgi:hypothetical protein